MLIATVSTQRSGTKLLATCFGAGTQIKPLGEIFNPDRIALGCWSQFVQANDYRSLQQQSPDVVLDQYFSHIFHTWRPIHFDLMFNQLEIPCLSWNPFTSFFMYGYLRSRNALVISLERDIVDTYVSGKLLEQTGIAHGHVAKEKLLIEPTPLDADDFEKYARTLRWHREQLYIAMADYHNFHTLTYAELATSIQIPPSTLAAILEWAKLHHLNLDPEFIQVHPSPTHKSAVDYNNVFSNIAELRSAAKALATL